jgi:hypothetical protein
MALEKTSATATRRKKTSASCLPRPLVLAATVLLIIAAVAGLITLALCVIVTESSSLGGVSVLGIGTSSSSVLAKGYIDPDLRSYGDPNEVVLRR